MSQTLNFTTLMSNAPTVKRRGRGNVGDPNYAHFTRIVSERSNTQTLKLPERFLTDSHYQSGVVTVDKSNNIIVIMSTRTKAENGAKWCSFHQRTDTRHLVIPKGSAVGDLLNSGSRNFQVSESTEVFDLPKHATAYTLKEIK